MLKGSHKSVSLRKATAGLAIAASFTIAVFFFLSSAITLLEKNIVSANVNHTRSSIFFRIRPTTERAARDPISRLYLDPVTRDRVVRFFSILTQSETVATAILENSIEYNIRPSLAFALAYAESRYNPRARSTNGSGSTNRGLFQLNTAVFNDISARELHDPFKNALLGLRHLREHLDQTGDEFSALAAYNAGLTRVARDGTPGMTFDYIAQITSVEKRILDFFLADIAASAALR